VTFAAVLVDLDGVLVDSGAVIDGVWRRWAALHGLEPEPLLAYLGGRRASDTIQMFAPHLDGESEAQRILEWECEDLDGVVALPGAHDLLTQSSLPVCVVTSCPQPLARMRLSAVGLPLDKPMVTGGDVSNGKPNPEPYLLGAERLGVSIASCLVIEDAPAGIDAGLAAGATVWAVRTTHPEPALERAHHRTATIESALAEMSYNRKGGGGPARC
jgi:mannitol-1-/sugar-/sorbitol-6-phosphatase